MPTLSVLLPVRDAQPTLRECLASLAAQSLIDHEVIAVDDGSSDESPELLAHAARQDPRIQVLRTRPRGIAAALNLALESARSPYLARMDADDVAHPERLRAQVERLDADPETAILGCRVRLLGAPRRGNAGMKRYVAWQNGLLEHDAIVRDLLVESPLAHPSVTMRRSAVRALGGYRVIDGPEDYDLWLRAHHAGLRFAKLPQVLLGWRDCAGRLSRTDPRYAPERFRALKLVALERSHLRPGRGVVIWGAGPIGKTWARALTRRGHTVEAFVEVHPRRLGRVIHGARVVGLDRARIRGPLHIAAVGQAGARERIRSAARSVGLVEGDDLVAVA